MPGASALIWISAKPLLQLIITTSFGYFLTKADLFGAAAAKGAGQVLLHIFLPSLLFSKIVPGFTAQNIVALGPLILVACIYKLYGFLIAWTVRKVFWVPRRFHNGILAAGIWGNWGDLPTAVVMSMTASAPFSKGDSDIAVAYLSAFILVFFVTLFPLGGHRLVAKDYADGAMPVDTDDDEIPESALVRMRRRWANLRAVIHAHHSTTGTDPESQYDGQAAQEKDLEIAFHYPQPLTRQVSFGPAEPTAYGGGQSTCPPTSAHASPAPTVVDGITTTLSQAQDLPTHKEASSPSPEGESQFQPNPSRFRRTLLSVWAFLVSLASAPTITMVVAFVVALVPTLKALFIAPAADSTVHIAPAPDGLPPLNLIIDTATFIGGGSIPLGLICLGSALAGLQAPKPFTRAPLGAIAMVVGPVFGVLVVEGLTHHTNLIDPNDKVLRFVCIYFAGVPTATAQVYLTQIYSPDGSASHISAFLIPQYALMFVTMTASSAYALNILF